MERIWTPPKKLMMLTVEAQPATEWPVSIVTTDQTQIDNSLESKTDRNMTVYRGIAIAQSDLPVGSEIDNKGFTSTSAVKSIADSYADYVQGTTIQIRVPKGTKALGIGANTSSGYDGAEILFGRDATIRIIKNGENGVIGELYYGKR